jgi:hypothetical protein
MNTVLNLACNILGWQGGTVHQVLDNVCAMNNREVNRFLSTLKYEILSNSITDGFDTFLTLYYTPIEQRTGYKITLSKPIQFKRKQKIAF